MRSIQICLCFILLRFSSDRFSSGYPSKKFCSRKCGKLAVNVRQAYPSTYIVVLKNGQLIRIEVRTGRKAANGKVNAPRIHRADVLMIAVPDGWVWEGPLAHLFTEKP
jgi:hypothetical protein